MAAGTSKVFQVNVFIDGETFFGFADEMTIPVVTATTQEHNSLGGFGTINLVTGMEAMEGEIKWKGMDKTIDKATANPYRERDLMVMGNIEQYAGTLGRVNKPFKYFMRVRFRATASADFASKTDVDSSTPYDCYAIKKEIDGEVMYDYDPRNKIHKVGGVDVLAEVRRNMGIA